MQGVLVLVRVRYDAHLPALSLWGMDNSWTLPAGTVLSTLNGHIIYKNWHICRVCWYYCARNYLHVPTPPEVVTAIYGLLKTAQGGDMSACSLAAAGRIHPQNPRHH